MRVVGLDEQFEEAMRPIKLMPKRSIALTEKLPIVLSARFWKLWSTEPKSSLKTPTKKPLPLTEKKPQAIHPDPMKCLLAKLAGSPDRIAADNGLNHNRPGPPPGPSLFWMSR